MPRLLEEVVTTASKKGVAEAAQDVGGAVSVLDGARLDALHVDDIEDLGYALPNVAFDGIGTGKGIANFSIRGMGVAGSIPSIDPTVGVFVDGMYLGVNYGVVMDMLDLEAMEVLRGPQGLLFGRNVIGGAVLLRSRRPSGESSGYASVRRSTGPETRVAAAAERSFADGALDARLAVRYRDDDGWFDNDAPGGGPVGAERAWAVRPVLTFRPAEDLDITVVLERGDSDGDGPASQNRYRFTGFDFAIDEPGFSRVDWRHVVVEAERRVGNGRIVNVFGARGVGHESLADIDSTTRPVFHLWAFTDQEQVSNELRYSGWLREDVELTLGGYAFGQRIRYRERRVLRGAWGLPFGGDQRHRTGGVFANVDFHPGERWTVSAGARHTVERKAVEIATAGAGGCDARSRRCDHDFEDEDTWRNVTPRLAVQRWFGNRSQVYGEYTRGFRSGGYNLRNTSPTASPGPFDEEAQDAVEIGLKDGTRPPTLECGRVPHPRARIAAAGDAAGCRRRRGPGDGEHRRRHDRGDRGRGRRGTRRGMHRQRVRRHRARRLRPGALRSGRRRIDGWGRAAQATPARAPHVRRGGPVPPPVGGTRPGDRAHRHRAPRRQRDRPRQHGGARRRRRTRRQRLFRPIALAPVHRVRPQPARRGVPAQPFRPDGTGRFDLLAVEGRADTRHGGEMGAPVGCRDGHGPCTNAALVHSISTEILTEIAPLSPCSPKPG